MNKDDDLNSEKMVEKCCSCVGWGPRSGTKKRWARPALTHVRANGLPGAMLDDNSFYTNNALVGNGIS